KGVGTLHSTSPRFLCIREAHMHQGASLSLLSEQEAVLGLFARFLCIGGFPSSLRPRAEQGLKGCNPRASSHPHFLHTPKSRHVDTHSFALPPFFRRYGTAHCTMPSMSKSKESPAAPVEIFHRLQSP